MPCGSCGRCDDLRCHDIQVSLSGKTWKAESKCPYFSGIGYFWANQGTKTVRCRNVPIKCGLCPKVSLRPRAQVWKGVWRYNMDAHIRAEHSEYASPSFPSPSSIPLPVNIWNSMEIYPNEYTDCGIDHTFLPPPFTLIDTSGPSMPPPATPSGGKRSRAFTATMSSLPASKHPRCK